MRTEVMRYDTAESVELLFSEEHANHDIGVGAWERSDTGLYTSAAAPCIVLAGYNHESRTGLLGHHSAISSQQKAPGSKRTNAEKFAEAAGALSELGNPEDTDIWLGGGAPLMFLGEDIVEPDRVLARKIVAEHLSEMRTAYTALHIRWSAADHCVDVEMDCIEGLLVVHDYQVEHWSPKKMRKLLKRLKD